MSTAPQYRLPVYDHRPGGGPTLVFLHYWGGSARTWSPVVDRLAGRSTLSIDFRGWSRSRGLRGPYTLEQLAEDTIAVVQAAGIDDHVLVGHSLGGKVAQLVAAARPQGLVGLVLVAPGPAKPAAEITPEYQQALSHAYDSADTVAAARDAVLTAGPLAPEPAEQVMADSLDGTPGARTEWPLHGIAQNVVPQARCIAVPTLVIAGQHDRVEPADVLRTNLLPYLPGARLSVIPGAGHLIPLEAPDELANRIAAFADVRWPTARGGCRRR